MPAAQMNQDDNHDEEREARIRELMERAQKEQDRAKAEKAKSRAPAKADPPKKK